MPAAGCTFTYRPRKKATGFVEGVIRKIALGFTPAMFKQINDLAEYNHISFREQVRQLCAKALRHT